MSLYAADDRAYLSAQDPQRYVLAAADGTPLITFGDADADGVMWLAEEPDGWDAPEVSTPMDRRQHGHGGYAGESTFNERVLPVKGSAAAPTSQAAAAARTALVNALMSNLNGWLLWTHLDDDPPKSLWVRPDGKPRIEITDGRWLDFTFTVTAEDPIKFGATATYGPTPLPTGLPARLAIPLTTPLTVLAGTPAPSLAVPNDGDEWAHATYAITGPVPAPQVSLDTGEVFALDATLNAGEVAVLDTRSGLVTVNDAHRLDLLSPGSTFPLIPPGGTTARFTSGGGGADPAAGLTVTTAPAWK